MTATPTTPYVFISYASADRERVLHIADRLERQGVSVWLDRRSIAGGSSWSAEIVDGIKGCAMLVVLVSSESMASRNVQQEVQLAWEHARPILPLLLERTPLPATVEYALAGRQWVEVLARPEAAWLAETVRALARPGLALPVAVPPALEPPPASPAASDSPPVMPAVVARPPHNLPAQLTSFIGRETELAEVRALLVGQRLVTLTGVGGTGKTRLALVAAERVLLDYPDGVWLVELAPLADPALVPQAVATALGIREQPGEPLTATLTRALQPQRVLLLLDNCEHLIDACARLVDALLRHCPTLRILTTSREQLGVPGEAPYRVPSLTLPTTAAPLAELA